MKIYTRAGDRGRTSLLSGRQVMKNDVWIEAYGSVDELISYTGLIRDLTEWPDMSDILMDIQKTLMAAASLLAAATDSNAVKNLPEVTDKDISLLETRIDMLEADMVPLKQFIIPGGHFLSSHCHIARAICRRAERNIVAVDSNLPHHQIVLKYLNRLSDFFFVFARWILKKNGINETYW